MLGNRGKQNTSEEEASASGRARAENAQLKSTKRRQNTPWIIGGIALVLLSGLAAASLASTEDPIVQRTPALIAARSIAEGRVITADDLQVVEVEGLPREVQIMDPATLDDVLGRIAAGPIGSGSFIHPDQFIIGGLGQEPTVVIGANLNPDEYPLQDLRRGDLVRIVEVRIEDFGDEDLPVRIDGRELAVAEIVAVRPTTGDGLHFSLRIGESSANVVLDRVARGRVSIALIDGAQAVRPAEPLTPADPLDPGDPAEIDSESGDG